MSFIRLYKSLGHVQQPMKFIMCLNLKKTTGFFIINSTGSIEDLEAFLVLFFGTETVRMLTPMLSPSVLC